MSSPTERRPSGTPPAGSTPNERRHRQHVYVARRLIEDRDGDVRQHLFTWTTNVIGFDLRRHPLLEGPLEALDRREQTTQVLGTVGSHAAQPCTAAPSRSWSRLGIGLRSAGRRGETSSGAPYGVRSAGLPVRHLARGGGHEGFNVR